MHIRIPIRGPVEPYAIVGGGLLHNTYDVTAAGLSAGSLVTYNSDDNFGFHAGGGARYYLRGELGRARRVPGHDQQSDTQPYIRRHLLPIRLTGLQGKHRAPTGLAPTSGFSVEVPGLSLAVQVVVLLSIVPTVELTTSRLHEIRCHRERSDVRQTHPAQTEPEGVTINFEIGHSDKGLLMVSGTESEAFALYVNNGRVVYHYQHVLDRWPIVLSSRRLSSGPATARFEFDPRSRTEFTRRGNGRLWVNGTPVGQVTPNTKRCVRCALNPAFRNLTFTGKIVGVVFDSHFDQGAGE